VAEQAFAVGHLIEVVTGRFKGRQGSIEAEPIAPGVFYQATLWPAKAVGRKGQAHYQPSQPLAKVSLTAGQMKLLLKDQPTRAPT
jgi:hypothetical protein